MFKKTYAFAKQREARKSIILERVKRKKRGKLSSKVIQKKDSSYSLAGYSDMNDLTALDPEKVTPPPPFLDFLKETSIKTTALRKNTGLVERCSSNLKTPEQEAGKSKFE